ncbi:glycoside hydrolase family 95 protein [Sphingobacterium sp. N143]|uniref:glycoside hydrolase family 95 protein n=1 Tax=Sphingobacterium sp. N143 TaxID=2746727 RepID=UPI002578965E|nr:glycoside hydrolase family 95 protein [Sphingobacterium sp. N143]MDM1292712.1 glycoside hydrolase family 95 protein [Sphingobacterium sp. N143]
MKINYLIFSIVLFLSWQLGASQELKLTYDKAAANWNEALPLGNGRIGAMVYGGVDKEEIQLNEETIWAGRPGNNVPKGKYNDIVKIRQLLTAGKNKEAQALSNQAFPRAAPEGLDYGMPYQTFGSLLLGFPTHDKPNQYQRELDLNKAITTITYEANGVNYRREMFTSLVDSVLVIRITADKGKCISMDLSWKSPHRDARIGQKNGALFLRGKGGQVDAKEGQVDFYGFVYPQVKGGQVNPTEGQIMIKDADEVILYVSIGTNFKNYQDLSVDPEQKATRIFEKARRVSYARALENHVKQYQRYFNRVQLDLGSSAQVRKTTDVRIREFATSFDPQLVALYFQFGRYLLISSSQPGGQPANLQGIWNDKLAPPWDSKYTININTEMNYWPAEVGNLSEMHQPLFSMIKDLAVTGQESAREMYHARGWNVHHNTDLWRISGVVDGGFYGMWPMGGAWLSQHIWQHYLYRGDTQFLRDYYDVLKGAALFYLDVLTKDPTGKWLVVSPSISPENSYETGSVGVSAGTTMDNQLLFDVFNNFIHASTVLHADAALRDSVRQSLQQLPPMQIGQHGQLQEWLSDLDRTNDHHRHISHLYGLFPSGQISPFRNPELAQAAKNSLIYRGDKSTGWSMGWKVNWWARLLDGNQSYKLIKDQLSPAPEEQQGQNGGTYPNLLDAHPPFQIDGNFGCTSGIAEMLLQSYDGSIFLLPAWPEELPNGEVKGLVARGGFIIDMRWKEGQLTALKVLSTLGGNCRIRVSDKSVLSLQGKPLHKANGKNTNTFFAVDEIKNPLIKTKKGLFKRPETVLYDVPTRKGEVYEFAVQ